MHGIFGVDRDDMFVDVILMHMVEMAVVKIVHMAVMVNRRVPTVRAMLMGVVGWCFSVQVVMIFLLSSTIRPGSSVTPSLQRVTSRFAPIVERGCPKARSRCVLPLVAV